MPAPSLHPTARAWRRAAEREVFARAARDAAIRAELAAGRGVREVGRLFGLDPTHVTTIRRRAGF